MTAGLTNKQAGSVTLHPNPPFETFFCEKSFMNGEVKKMK